eukprot:416070-Prorocentrum_minimum.AAC.2
MHMVPLIPQVLIYNLPETVKEADIEKLSFAAEIAEEFSGRVNVSSAPNLQVFYSSCSGPLLKRFSTFGAGLF